MIQMRTLMTLALTIFSMTACAVDTTSTEPVEIPALDSPRDGIRAQLGERCTTNNDCESLSCDIVSRSCVTPEGEGGDSEDDATDGPTAPDLDITGDTAELDSDSDVPPRDPPRPPARCTSNSHCESNTCDLATRRCMPAEAEPASPHTPDTESATSIDDELQAAPEHIRCNPLVNCYPF